MTDELDEILNIHTIDAGNRVLKLIDVNEAKQAIQALIADQMAEYQAQLLKDYKEDIATAVREARIDELNRIPRINYGNDFAIHINAYLDDRIKEIKRSKE